MEGQQARENLVNLIRANPEAFKAAFFRAEAPNVEDLTAALTGAGPISPAPVSDSIPSAAVGPGVTGPLPKTLSPKVLEESAQYRDFLKSAKKSGRKPIHMELDLISVSVYQKMSAPERFVHKRYDHTLSK